MNYRSRGGFTIPERVFVWGVTAAGVMAILAGVMAILAGVIGWIMNIVKLVGLVGQPMSEVQVELIVRIVFAFTILPGAIAGWF